MAWPAGNGHLKPNGVVRVARLSTSDEYEESDAEAEQVFLVKRIVEEKKLIKGRVRFQMEGLPHACDVGKLESSKLDYAFKVRWRGFEEKDDTWEPIENFNNTMSNRLRKYCRRRGIKLPEDFRDWMLPAEGGEEESSGTEQDTPRSNKARANTSRSPSPQPSTSRPKVENTVETNRNVKQLLRDLELSPTPSPMPPPKNKTKLDVPSPQPSTSPKVENKVETNRNMQQLLRDLELSPTPSPMPPPKNKTKLDVLFDSSGDEKKKKIKKEEGQSSVTLSPKNTPTQRKMKRKGPLISGKDLGKQTSKSTPIQRKKKRDGSMDSGEKQRKPVMLKRTPTQVKKKRDGSMDSGESQRKQVTLKRTSNQVKKKSQRDEVIELDDDDQDISREMKIKKKKNEERKRRNSALSISDESDNKKEEEDERKKMDRAAVKKRAAAILKELEDEGKLIKKEKMPVKRSPSGIKGKAQPAGLEKLKGGASTFGGALNQTKPTSHFAAEMLRKRKEQKQREKGLYNKKDDSKRDGQEKKEGKLGAKTEPKSTGFRIPKKKEVRPESREEMKEVEFKIWPVLPVPTTRFEKKEERRESGEEVKKVKKAHGKPRCPSGSPSKAVNRLEVIKKRLESFALAAAQRERRQEERWEREEEEWRKGMYERGLWKREERIKDVPFSFRAEQQLKDTKHVRTLRRCTSAERLPVSFRRLSSIHPMDSLPSKADSLAEALVEMREGEKVRHLRQPREQFEEKKREEVMKEEKKTKVKKEEKAVKKKRDEDSKEKTVRKEVKVEEKEEMERQDVPPAMGHQDVEGKTELFISETLAMAQELMPGEMSEEMVRELSLRAIAAFLVVDHEGLIPILREKIRMQEGVEQMILRLVRIFSPIVNVAVAVDGCRSVCDEGEHRRCRMLLTLLMSMSHRNRVGDDDSSLLPPNALYDALELSAPCQLRAMIRGGCTFDLYYDDEGKNAAHRMMEKCSPTQLEWLIERGLDVNSAIMPKKDEDVSHEFYDKPWKICKESNEKAAFISQLHSQRLTARSIVWTKSVRGVGNYNLRPLTLVHTLNPHAYFHRLAAVTLCDDQRKGFDRDDAVLLAIHSASVRKGAGVRAPVRKAKKVTAELRIPYFLIEQAEDGERGVEKEEKYECARARLTIHNLDDSSLSETVELTRLGANGATTVYKVPKKQAQMLVSGRRFTECLLKLDFPPEHSVILAQYFIVPIKTATGKTMD